MRFLLSVVLLFSLNLVTAQKTIYPSRGIVGKEFLHDDRFSFKLYGLHDSMKRALGSLEVIITVDSEARRLIYVYIQKVGPANFTALLVDSVIISTEDFSPIYHSTRRQGDETMLNFEGNRVNGEWYVFNRVRDIIDSTTPPFFDYHILPLLVCWLPLKEGENYELPVYDFIVGRHSMTSVSITNIETLYSDNREIRKITVKEHIRKNSGTVFYVDANSHKLLRADIEKGDKKTQMVRENPPSL